MNRMRPAINSPVSIDSPDILDKEVDAEVLNVLIVEDDVSMGELLRDALEHEGYYVTDVARTVEEAMASAALYRHDFAIIDLHLAKGDSGADVAERLRQTGHIGIIFSTGNDDRTLTGDQGDAVMAKPYRMRDAARGLRIIGDLQRMGRTELSMPRNFRLLRSSFG